MSRLVSEIEIRLDRHPRAGDLPDRSLPDFDGRRITIEAGSLPLLQQAGVNVSGDFGPGNVVFLPREGVFRKMKLSFAEGAQDNLLSLASSEKMNLEIKFGGSRNVCVFKGANTIGGTVNFGGSGGVLLVGYETTANHFDVLIANPDRIVTIGDECMMAKDIVLRTSDSHAVLDLLEERVINPVEDLHIGPHVWLGARTTVMKGVRIGRGCVIGGGSIVTRDVPPFSLAVGVPARVVKENVSWSRAMLPDPAKARLFARELKDRLNFGRAEDDARALAPADGGGPPAPPERGGHE